MKPTFATSAAGSMLLGALALAGCADAEAHLTMDPDKFAAQAADVLGKKVGQAAHADCGKESINIVDGNVVHCKLGPDADRTTVYDATVTISEVKGKKFHLDVENSTTTISPDASLPPQSK